MRILRTCECVTRQTGEHELHASEGGRDAAGHAACARRRSRERPSSSTATRSPRRSWPSAPPAWRAVWPPPAIGAGDRVALWLPNRPEWLELHLALARLGALTVADQHALPRARGARPARALRRPRARASRPASRASTSRGSSREAERRRRPIRVGEPGYDALLAHEPAGDASEPDAPCVAFTSSGTTGRPKLVVHAQRGIVAHARAVAAGFGYDAPDCVALAMLPLCGVFGYDSALGALAGGAPVVLQEAFDAGEAARLVERHRVTHANGSDAMVLRLLAAAPDPPLREAGFAAFDGDPRAVVDAGDAPARPPTCVTARPRSRRCWRTRRRTARPSGARSPAARRSRRRRGAGRRRRRARGARPERDGRLPRRRAAGPDRGRLPAHGRPRPRARPTAASPSPPAAATRCGSAASSSARARSRRSSSRATTSPRRPSSPSSTRARRGPSPSPSSRDGAELDEAGGARALPREPRRLQGAAPGARARRAAVHRLPQRPQGAALASCAGSRPKRCRKLQPRREERAMSAPSSTGPTTTDPPRQGRA